MNRHLLKTTEVPSDSVRAVLSRVKAELTPNHWCQKVPARNRRGYRVEPTDQAAVKHCLMGKLRSLQLPTDMQTCAMYKLNAAAFKAHRMPAHLVNDKHGYSATMDVLDAAIGNCAEVTV